MSTDLKSKIDCLGYIFGVPSYEVNGCLDYLDFLGVERTRYYFTPLALKVTYDYVFFHNIIVFSGSDELDILINLKYGQFLIGKMHGDKNGYHKYYVNGNSRA